MTFNDFNFDSTLIDGLQSMGYKAPTPIQQQAIPVIQQGKDLIACAQTGTGKTAAFVLPILDKIIKAKKGGINTLIIAPTRELVLQIDQQIEGMAYFCGVSSIGIYGGNDGVVWERQAKALREGVDIVIATPGRLIALLQSGDVKFDTIEHLILDEADRMLDMGFIHDVKKIITKIPQKRQTLFFSATMPPEIQKLANVLLTNPAKVEVTPPSSTVDKIEQSLYHVGKMEKPQLLLHLLSNKEIRTALVFTRTKHGADKVVKILQQHQIRAAAIHGNKSQNARQGALNDFKNGTLRVLVATDIAARGIDIDELTHVFNFDLPNVPETYVHRIGRTGRAGNTGIAISFSSAEEREELRDIQKLIGKMIPVIHEHPFIMSANTRAPEPVQRQQRSQSSFQPRRSNGQSQGAGNGNHVRRGYGAQQRGR